MGITMTKINFTHVVYAYKTSRLYFKRAGGKTLFFKSCHQFIEAIHCRLQIFNDISCQDIGIGQAFKICQGLVLDPEDIQAGLIPLQNFFNAELAPATIGILLRPSFGALMPGSPGDSTE